MKTGVILEIKDGKAVLLTNGEFLTLTAQPDWKTGDVVCVKQKRTASYPARALAAAACIILFSLSFLGYGAWFDTASLISLDVNPSIELQVNRLDRVISYKAYNSEGKEILLQSNIRNQKIDQALALLFENGLEDYLAESPYITYSVSSANQEKESKLISRLKRVTDSLLAGYPQAAEAMVDFYPVDDELVYDAHCHHVTAGKYITILKLQEVMPEARIEEYAHCGIGEIHQEIERCAGHGRTNDGDPESGPGLGGGGSGRNDPAGEGLPSDGGGAGQNDPAGQSSGQNDSTGAGSGQNGTGGGSLPPVNGGNGCGQGHHHHGNGEGHE